MAIYGYARVSTQKQSIERQIRNILAAEPEAKIFQDHYTGTKKEGRSDWLRLLKLLRPGDKVVFDSVCRMSRNADEGFADYQMLFEQGVTLRFLKESHIDTAVYKKALEVDIRMTDTPADILLIAIKQYLMEIARQQIRLAFENSEAEVVRLRVRTREGIETAKRNGKQIGRPGGVTYNTKKSIAAKQDILRHAKDFGGSLLDKDCIRMIGCTPNTYYKYKRELKEELDG